MRILITCIGGFYSYDLVRAIRLRKKCFILGVDRNPDTNAFFVNQFISVPDPNKNELNFINTLIKICKKFRIKIILPGSDKETLLISKYLAKFKKFKILTPVSDFNIVKIINDKFKLFKFLSNSGIDVGKFQKINSLKELKKYLSRFEYPSKKVIIKPTNSSGSRGVLILDKNIKKFRYLLKDQSRFCGIGSINAIEKELVLKKYKIRNYMIMPYHENETYDVDCLAEKGELKLCIPRLRIYKNPLSPINEGCQITNRKIINNYCSKILKKLKIDSICDFDIVIRADKKPQILDVGCRLSGSSTASLPIGINVPYNLIKILTKKKLDKINIDKDRLVFPKSRYELVR